MDAVVDVEQFYSDLLWELGELAHAGGTAVGAAAVVKRVALRHGVMAAARIPVPRLSRSQQEEFGLTGVSKRRARRSAS